MKPFDIKKVATIKIFSENDKEIASYDVTSTPEESHSVMLFVTDEQYTGCISNARILEILNVHAAIVNILEDKGVDAKDLETLMSIAEGKNKNKNNSTSDSFNTFMNRMMKS